MAMRFLGRVIGVPGLGVITEPNLKGIEEIFDEVYSGDIDIGIAEEVKREDEIEKQREAEFEHITGMPLKFATAAEINAFERRFERERASYAGVPYVPEEMISPIRGEEMDFEDVAKGLYERLGAEELLLLNPESGGMEIINPEEKQDFLTTESEGWLTTYFDGEGRIKYEPLGFYDPSWQAEEFSIEKLYGEGW